MVAMLRICGLAASPAAIANAVTNAIGVRVPFVPRTPDRVVAALNLIIQGGVHAGI
jgi:uncharacterized protein (DUF2062 family)